MPANAIIEDREQRSLSTKSKNKERTPPWSLADNCRTSNIDAGRRSSANIDLDQTGNFENSMISIEPIRAISNKGTVLNSKNCVESGAVIETEAEETESDLKISSSEAETVGHKTFNSLESDGGKGKEWKHTIKNDDCDPKIRNREIVNRLMFRLASDGMMVFKDKMSLKVPKLTKNSQDIVAEAEGGKATKSKYFTESESANSESARKKLKARKANFKSPKSKEHKRSKDGHNSAQRAIVRKTSSENLKNGINENVTKKKRVHEEQVNNEKKERTKNGEHFSSKRPQLDQKCPTRERSLDPKIKNPDFFSKLNKKEERAIFCNGVRVLLSKPERKIFLEKKTLDQNNEEQTRSRSMEEKKEKLKESPSRSPSQQVYVKEEGVRQCRRPRLRLIMKYNNVDDIGHETKTTMMTIA